MGEGRLGADARRHEVVAPDLPAHGHDTTSTAAASLDAHVSKIESASGEGPVVLVGHSLGGVVITALAERHPERVARLVYLAAYLPESGGTVLALATSDVDSALGPHLRPDPTTGLIAVAAEGYDVLLSGCDAQTIADARARSAPDPIAPFATPVTRTAERFGRVPRTYVRTTHDRAVSPSLQARMIAAIPCERVLEIPSGHAPFLESPAALAALLDRAARE